MDASIKKIIELIKKTGDRFIIWETDSNEPYVVMPLANYEKLVGTEASSSPASSVQLGGPTSSAADAQLLERINNDIVAWQSKKKKDDGLTKIDFAEKQKTLSSVAPVLVNDAAVTKEKEADDEEEYFFEPVE